MREQSLNGYVLHHRPYQEKRVIYQFFSYEFGVVHGIGARGLPLFTPVRLWATGKHALKTFSQSQLGFDYQLIDELSQAGFDTLELTNLSLIKGRVQYAMLYLNEILYKLLAAENSCPSLWQAYHLKMGQLQALDEMTHLPYGELMQILRVYLREFERALFAELGVMLDFEQDFTGNRINHQTMYRFIPEMGFVSDRSTAIETVKKSAKAKVSRIRYAGEDLQAMSYADDEPSLYLQYLNQFSQLQKELLDYLLEYKPLHSRTLWQQSTIYQNQ